MATSARRPFTLAAPLILSACATTSTSTPPAAPSSALEPLAPASGGPGGPKTKGSPGLRDARAFFDRFVRLERGFDPAVFDLYADDAELTMNRIGPDGQTKPFRLTGAQFKAIGRKTLAFSQARGDTNDYSNPRFSETAEGVTITVARRSNLKCFTDDAHQLELRKKPSGGFEIKAEKGLSRSLSACPDEDLKPLMVELLRPIRGRLPLQVDEDTRLDQVTESDSALTYVFTLVTVGPGELDSTVFGPQMKQTLKVQACLNAPFRKFLDNGGILGYDYRTRDGQPLYAVSLTELDCA